MLFNSIEFLLFFPIVTILYFLLPHKFRWLLLLIASCYFYMFFIPVYILILGGTIVIDYIAGIMIENAEKGKRKFFLAISIIANISVLAIFKYYNFFIDNIDSAANSAQLGFALPLLSIALPIGLSFHTFQAMSYTIEVYRGNQNAERHFGIYALYVMFYPQLVAGPIERPQNMLHQFHEAHEFDAQQVTKGLQTMLWGLFKKTVIADRLAVYVDGVYDNLHSYDGWHIMIATVFFAFEIYCDFSGYSDIAIGAAQVMGFKLMTNFNRPYHSKSISEFWKRWHISLSTWFKDYLYIPLGGNRQSKPKWYFNLFFTFLISGIWHGANWTFVIWGAINGLYLLFSIWTENNRKRITELIGLRAHPLLHNRLRVILTFILTCYAWMFFRANNLSDALYIHTAVVKTFLHPMELTASPIGSGEFLVCVSGILFLETAHYYQTKREMWTSLDDKPLWQRWAVYYAFILAILVFGKFAARQFIYFQF